MPSTPAPIPSFPSNELGCIQVGKRVSIILKSNMRYEGTNTAFIETTDPEYTLSNVIAFGMEGRPDIMAMNPPPMSDKPVPVGQFVFRASHLRDVKIMPDAVDPVNRLPGPDSPANRQLMARLADSKERAPDSTTAAPASVVKTDTPATIRAWNDIVEESAVEDLARLRASQDARKPHASMPGHRDPVHDRARPHAPALPPPTRRPTPADTDTRLADLKRELSKLTSGTSCECLRVYSPHLREAWAKADTAKAQMASSQMHEDRIARRLARVQTKYGIVKARLAQTNDRVRGIDAEWEEAIKGFHWNIHVQAQLYIAQVASAYGDVRDEREKLRTRVIELERWSAESNVVRSALEEELESIKAERKNQAHAIVADPETAPDFYASEKQVRAQVRAQVRELEASRKDTLSRFDLLQKRHEKIMTDLQRATKGRRATNAQLQPSDTQPKESHPPTTTTSRSRPIPIPNPNSSSTAPTARAKPHGVDLSKFDASLAHIHAMTDQTVVIQNQLTKFQDDHARTLDDHLLRIRIQDTERGAMQRYMDLQAEELHALKCACLTERRDIGVMVQPSDFEHEEEEEDDDVERSNLLKKIHVVLSNRKKGADTSEGKESQLSTKKKPESEVDGKEGAVSVQVSVDIAAGLAKAGDVEMRSETNRKMTIGKDVEMKTANAAEPCTQ
ncbi:hypothetical protein HKX48_005284 [Thoreauomyces humboldtii]|nr:hypothetical protein HKX48_005284 [Thoreauomyces humboldtii]